jgi:hypothetical protein
MQIVRIMNENSKMIREKERVPSHGLKEDNILENGKLENNMVEVPTLVKTEQGEWENGREEERSGG